MNAPRRTSMRCCALAVCAAIAAVPIVAPPAVAARAGGGGGDAGQWVAGGDGLAILPVATSTRGEAAPRGGTPFAVAGLEPVCVVGHAVVAGASEARRTAAHGDWGRVGWALPLLI